MYAVGKMPDHVTRYNHKNQSRWLVMTAPPRRVSVWDVVERIAITMGVMAIGAGLVTTAVYIMQGVMI